MSDNRKCGVVICYPIGHEYIHGYRALRQLAQQLARAGFSVLRFDYFGCGDSAGDSVEGDFPQWMNDIQSAIKELRSRAAMCKICLVGARVGATLATLVGAKRPDIDALVLWDPVVDGKRYLDDLMGQQRRWLDERPFIMQGPDSHDQMLEVLGFPINAGLKEALERLDLLQGKAPPAKRVLTLESSGPASGIQLTEHFKMIDADSEYMHIPMPPVWIRRAVGDDVVVPAPILRTIVDWLTRLAT